MSHTSISHDWRTWLENLSLLAVHTYSFAAAAACSGGYRAPKRLQMIFFHIWMQWVISVQPDGLNGEKVKAAKDKLQCQNVGEMRDADHLRSLYNYLSILFVR